MFNEIGKKLKGLALAMFIIGAVASIIIGTVLLIIGIDLEEILLWLTGIFTMIFGVIASWISSWFLYGFGELVDKTCDIERNTRPEKKKAVAQTAQPKTEPEQPKVDPERIKKIETLRALGVITEEEYQSERAKIIDKL